jgi:hypothetical protein
MNQSNNFTKSLGNLSEREDKAQITRLDWNRKNSSTSDRLAVERSQRESGRRCGV